MAAAEVMRTPNPKGEVTRTGRGPNLQQGRNEEGGGGGEIPTEKWGVQVEGEGPGGGSGRPRCPPALGKPIPLICWADRLGGCAVYLVVPGRPEASAE